MVIGVAPNISMIRLGVRASTPIFIPFRSSTVSMRFVDWTPEPGKLNSESGWTRS